LPIYNLIIEIVSVSSHRGGSKIGATYNNVIEVDIVNNHSGGSNIEAAYNPVIEIDSANIHSGGSTICSLVYQPMKSNHAFLSTNEV
jgi:hypothetical protein